MKKRLISKIIIIINCIFIVGNLYAKAENVPNVPSTKLVSAFKVKLVVPEDAYELSNTSPSTVKFFAPSSEITWFLERRGNGMFHSTPIPLKTLARPHQLLVLKMKYLLFQQMLEDKLLKKYRL